MIYLDCGLLDQLSNAYLSLMRFGANIECRIWFFMEMIKWTNKVVVLFLSCALALCRMHYDVNTSYDNEIWIIEVLCLFLSCLYGSI